MLISVSENKLFLFFQNYMYLCQESCSCFSKINCSSCCKYSSLLTTKFVLVFFSNFFSEQVRLSSRPSRPIFFLIFFREKAVYPLRDIRHFSRIFFENFFRVNLSINSTKFVLVFFLIFFWQKAWHSQSWN